VKAIAGVGFLLVFIGSIVALIGIIEGLVGCASHHGGTVGDAIILFFVGSIIAWGGRQLVKATGLDK